MHLWFFILILECAVYIIDDALWYNVHFMNFSPGEVDNLSLICISRVLKGKIRVKRFRIS